MSTMFTIVVSRFETTYFAFQMDELVEDAPRRTPLRHARHVNGMSMPFEQSTELQAGHISETVFVAKRSLASAESLEQQTR
jgi:hypothetical protein